MPAPPSPPSTSSAPSPTGRPSCTSPATEPLSTASPPSASTARAWIAQSFDLVRDGTLVGYQLDRSIAAAMGFERSNGCAFADSPMHVPIQRMANVSLAHAGAEGPSTEDLIAGVDRGIFIVGDKSWSIDMQRYNFQFTGQRFYAIENGRLAGQRQGRRLPGDHHRLLGRHGGRRGRVHLGARRRLQLRQGPARARWPRSRTAARRSSCAACGSSTPARSRDAEHGRVIGADDESGDEVIPAQELVEHGLARADAARGRRLRRAGRGRQPCRRALRAEHDHDQRRAARAGRQRDRVRRRVVGHGTAHRRRRHRGRGRDGGRRAGRRQGRTGGRGRLRTGRTG